MPIISDIMLVSNIISFHGFSSGVVPKAYAVKRRILISKGIMSGSAITEVNDAFWEVLIAMDEINVKRKARPKEAIRPVAINQPTLTK